MKEILNKEFMGFTLRFYLMSLAFITGWAYIITIIIHNLGNWIESLVK